ncbi:MAG: hypothetical protein M1821_000050 [Bathelium mastoideum]|nr:MAG: hypothetical protein M1821_000050 [Bathelium mastoideum]KAI9687918.1 MAG: hypothetical protein M1822_002000 [Bathelium mastoideum]
MFPQAIFGTMTALAAYLLGQPTSLPLNFEFITSRFILALFWTWINLLPFNIQNQLDDAAIEEDRVNKPWRPLPSGRVNPSLARTWMNLFYCAALLTSLRLGGLRQCLALLGLGYWYNRAGGSDCSWAVRNLINAYGFISFASGAMECALGTQVLLTKSLLQWFSIIGAIVFCTVQTQDMYDMEGDAARGRSTLPLVIGDGPARWSIAIAVIFFSFMSFLFWNAQWVRGNFPLLLGCVIALRTLTYRTVAADKRTFQLWNLWLVSIYSTPVVRHFLS